MPAPPGSSCSTTPAAWSPSSRSPATTREALLTDPPAADADATALLVIGLALLALSGAGRVGRRAVAVFFGAGAMTLTLYSLHVVARSRDLLPDEFRDRYLFHVLLLLGIGAVFAATHSRGPLEGLVRAASRAVAGVRAPRLAP